MIPLRVGDSSPESSSRQIDVWAIVGPQAFTRLPARVRNRFAPHRPQNRKVTYSGIMHTVESSALGRLIAYFGRLIGSPLVAGTGYNVPCTVSLLPDTELGGTIWHRLYVFPEGRETAATTKRSGDDGTPVESFNRWCGMGLDIQVRAGELHFTADKYFVEWRGRRLQLPRWLSPGRLAIVHRDEGGGRFRFVMTLQHPLFGVIMYQNGEFYDPEDHP